MTAGHARALRLPPRWFVRTAWVLHRALYSCTGGRFGLWRPQAGGRFGTLRLTTRGRRSGRPRVAIVGYYEDGPNLVTLAMNGWAAPAPRSARSARLGSVGVVPSPPRRPASPRPPGRRQSARSPGQAGDSQQGPWGGTGCRARPRGGRLRGMGAVPDLSTAERDGINVNDLIAFGSFPQSSASDVAEPIEWRVLGRSAAAVLLLSDRILDCRRYHSELVETTWRDSDLRAWLNSEFFGSAFGEDEHERILPTSCGNNGDGTPDTVDRVFLLSVHEVRTLTALTPDARPRRAAIGTVFARLPRVDGCRLYVYDKGVERDYITANGVRQGCSWWWTRTQLQVADGRSARAAFVGARGDVKSYGRVDLARYGVRPAIRLSLPGA